MHVYINLLPLNFKKLLLAGPSNSSCIADHNTVKPVLSGHSKIDKTKALKTGGGLVQVKSINCGAFCNTYDLY